VHLDLVKAQAVARLKRDYEADIASYDKGELHLLAMADELTCGIIRQFPQFRKHGFCGDWAAVR